MRKELAGRKDSRIGQALMQAGFATMAGKSPYALANIGEGAGVGLKQYLDSERLDAADKQKLLQISATIEQAQRAEAIGNVDAAMKDKQAAIQLHATMSKDGQALTANLIHSMVSGTTQLESQREQRYATQANVGAQMALKKMMAEQATADREAKTSMDERTRYANVLSHITTEAEKALKDHTDITKGGAIMTEDQKKSWVADYVRRNMKYQVDLNKAMSNKGGIGSFEIPDVAPVMTFTGPPPRR
jgi:hypothetical protein